MAAPNASEMLPALRVLLEDASPGVVMQTALERLGDDVAISFSGAEDVVLIEYAKQSGRPFRVFALDTGRLHPETYRFYDHVEKHYDIRIEHCFPEKAEVEALVRKKGLFSFYEDGHQECCGIRKVGPLRRFLSGVSGWVTGQRRDQSPTRASVAAVELDDTFVGKDGGPLLKFNPLANRSRDEVWAAIQAFEVPYNELHQRGMISIGCEPCTRAVLPGQHERDGRWWWERADSKECGLHARNKG